MVAEIIDPSESCRKLRRVTFTIDFADGSLKSKLIIFAQDRGVKWMNSPGRGSGPDAEWRWDTAGRRLVRKDTARANRR